MSTSILVLGTGDGDQHFMPSQNRRPGVLRYIICRKNECRKIFRGKKGDGDFIDDILKEAEEYYHQRQALRPQGITLAHEVKNLRMSH